MYAVEFLEAGQEPRVVHVFANGRDAGVYAREMNEVTAPGNHYRVVRQAVTAIADATAPAVEVDTSWRRREYDKLANGTYRSTPWRWEEFCLRSEGDVAQHFAHVSLDDPSMVAFTENNDKGLRDIQTRMKPARYLNKFFPEIGQDAARDWAVKWSAEFEMTDSAIKFAETADEIERVYVNGPSSCMSKEADYYSTNGVHPSRAYAGFDLQVAYLERAGEITARAVCWPSEKIYTRVYGDEYRFEQLIQAMGYTKDDLEGAKVSRIETPHGDFVMPYLDGPGSADDMGDYLILTSSGEIDCQSTAGVAEVGSRWTCARCEERADEDDSVWISDREERWCSYCVSNHATCCYGCGATNSHDRSGITTARGHDVCESCMDNYTHCGHCDEYHVNDRVEEDTDGDMVCHGCASDLERGECNRPIPEGSTCECSECEQAKEEAEEDEDTAPSVPLPHTINATASQLEAEGQLVLEEVLAS